ncbi:hypothetical protein [Streptomyces sp. HUAS TT7]|uniref:hypothetical protein n=1 Tax=Streptomyces sp. HUAS TT7 TaxID=3447507 RepID=UPI003F658CBD
MEALWTSAVAVVGTLLGGVVTHVLQGRAARQSELFTRGESLRQERIAAYSSFASAVEDFRRGQADRWYRKQEDPDGEAHVVASAEAHRLRAVARQALYRVKLLAGDRGLVDAGEHALQCTRDVSNALDPEQRGQLDDAAKAAIEQFIELAAQRILPDATRTTGTPS